MSTMITRIIRIGGTIEEHYPIVPPPSSSSSQVDSSDNNNNNNSLPVSHYSKRRQRTASPQRSSSTESSLILAPNTNMSQSTTEQSDTSRIRQPSLHRMVVLTALLLPLHCSILVVESWSLPTVPLSRSALAATVPATARSTQFSSSTMRRRWRQSDVTSVLESPIVVNQNNKHFLDSLLSSADSTLWNMKLSSSSSTITSSSNVNRHSLWQQRQQQQSSSAIQKALSERGHPSNERPWSMFLHRSPATKTARTTATQAPPTLVVPRLAVDLDEVEKRLERRGILGFDVFELQATRHSESVSAADLEEEEEEENGSPNSFFRTPLSSSHRTSSSSSASFFVHPGVEVEDEDSMEDNDEQVESADFFSWSNAPLSTKAATAAAAANRAFFAAPTATASSSLLSTTHESSSSSLVLPAWFPWIPTKSQIQSLKVNELKEACFQRGLLKVRTHVRMYVHVRMSILFSIFSASSDVPFLSTLFPWPETDGK
jgi:hypothetical protein